MRKQESARHLRLRLRKLGLSNAAVKAAWPTWWSDDADTSASARVELRFSVARKLGLDPESLLDAESEPSFVWRDEARFKHLSGESAVEQSAITSFGRAVGSLLVAASPPAVSIRNIEPGAVRDLILHSGQEYVRLLDLLSLCWSAGIPVIHLRLFPWPHKRMAAMAVAVGERCAILLGKDSTYPAQISFYLAHEIGHIALGHVGEDRVVVDLEQTSPVFGGDDMEERAADRFALELLTGSSEPRVRPFRRRYSARELARVALASAPQLGIEPGTLALCFGYSTRDWATASASMRSIYASAKPVWNEVNQVARTQLALERVASDALDYLKTVLGPGVL